MYTHLVSASRTEVKGTQVRTLTSSRAVRVRVVSSPARMGSSHRKVLHGGAGMRGRGSGPCTWWGCQNTLNVLAASQTTVLAPKGTWVEDGLSSAVPAPGVATAKYHKLGSSRTKAFISHYPEAGSPRSWPLQIPCLARVCF